jgi:hypothetical protein
MLYGTRAQLAAGNGDVEGYLALAGCDRRAGTASYALRIINQSAHPLRARMTCARLRGEPVLAYPLDIQIAPFAICETLLPVRLTDVGPYDRAIVNIAGGDVAFSLEAPAPKRERKRSRWIAGGAAALLFTVGTAFAAASATPRIGGIAAPARAFAGTTIDVPYAFAGLASMRYQLETPDRRQLSAGLVQAHQGTLHFHVPPAAGHSVVLDVTVAGPFGRRHFEQSIAVDGTAPKKLSAPALNANAPLRIAAFTVVDATIQAGRTLTFAYATNARAGEIWLLDESGRLWARKPIYADGRTRIYLPDGAAGHQIRAVLHARSGASDAISSITFTALPGDAANTASQTPAAQSGTPVLTISNDSVAPGDTIAVAVKGAHGDTQISLTDASGNSIEDGDIPAGQSAFTMTAPSTATQATYYVTASVSDGTGAQTLVKTLTVTPRATP